MSRKELQRPPSSVLTDVRPLCPDGDEEDVPAVIHGLLHGGAGGLEALGGGGVPEVDEGVNNEDDLP